MPLLDGGFESGGTGTPWVISGLTGFNTAPGSPVHAGTYSLGVGSEDLAGGVAYQTVATTPGQLLALSGWYYADAESVSGDRPLQVYVDLNPGDGSNLVLIDTLTPSVIGGGAWVYQDHGTSVAVVEQVTFMWINPAPVVGALAAWFMDDIDLLMTAEDEDGAMARKWAAIAASIEVLKDIIGSDDDYNTNFDGRIYSRLFTPAEQSDVVRPYACVPLDQEGERLEYEGFAFTSTWRLVGHAFFDDNPETDPLNSDGSEQAAKFRDDLVRAFMTDQTLGGAALNCEVTAIDTSSGVIEDGIAEVIFTIEFTQMAGASDLSAE